MVIRIARVIIVKRYQKYTPCIPDRVNRFTVIAFSLSGYYLANDEPLSLYDKMRFYMSAPD
ncbi:MAG: hypothetical protein ABW174_02810, partial [Flavitalea sp.]